MAKSDKDDEKDEITPVGPGAEERFVNEDDEQEEPQRRQATNPDDDEEESSEDERGDGEHEDERAGHAEGEDSHEERLERRRQRRQRKRDQHRRDQTELRLLRTRNEQLERQFSAQDSRITQTELAAIDTHIRQTEEQLRQAEEIQRVALEKGDSSGAVEAQKLQNEFRDGLTQLKNVRTQTANSARARQEQGNAQPSVDPRQAQRAREWAQENRDWFDPTGADEASAIAYTVERSLFREGRLDPASDEYWDEVDRRLTKRLPEVFGNSREGRDDEDGGERREPPRRNNGNGRAARGPVFRTGGRERTLRRGEVYVDAERRKALEESGAWDDPELRERYLKSYQKYDREHGRRH